MKKVLSVYHRVFFICLIESTECPDKERKMIKIWYRFFFLVVWRTKNVNFLPRWGTNSCNYKLGGGNDCDVILGYYVLRQKTTEKFACRETECPVEAAKSLGLCSDSSYNYHGHIKKIISPCCTRIYKLFIINRIKRLLDRKTHTFFKTTPLYLPSYFTVPRCELPQIKIWWNCD